MADSADIEIEVSRITTTTRATHTEIVGEAGVEAIRPVLLIDLRKYVSNVIPSPIFQKNKLYQCGRPNYFSKL